MHKPIFQGSKLAHASRPIFSAACKYVAYHSPPNVHIYSLLAEQLCCSVMSLLV